MIINKRKKKQSLLKHPNELRPLIISNTWLNYPGDRIHYMWKAVKIPLNVIANTLLEFSNCILPWTAAFLIFIHIFMTIHILRGYLRFLDEITVVNTIPRHTLISSNEMHHKTISGTIYHCIGHFYYKPAFVIISSSAPRENWVMKSNITKPGIVLAMHCHYGSLSISQLIQ